MLQLFIAGLIAYKVTHFFKAWATAFRFNPAPEWFVTVSIGAGMGACGLLNVEKWYVVGIAAGALAGVNFTLIRLLHVLGDVAKAAFLKEVDSTPRRRT